MSPKDRSKQPPHASEPLPDATKPADSDIEWPRQLAHLVEAVVSAELHEFEDNVLAFFDSAVEDAYSTFIWMCARAVGAAFLLTGLMLFLGVFLQWWAAFALVGVVIIALGALVSRRRRPRRRRSRR
jgi:hypothetical protein